MPPRLLRAILFRGVLIWIGARVIANATLAYAQIEPGPMVPLWSVAAAAALCLVDFGRRKESMLLGILGIATWNAVLVGTIPAVAIEAVIAAAR